MKVLASEPANNVGYYARVSSDQQAENGTIASQIAALEQGLKQDGLCAKEELRFVDDGYSGSTLVRPALEQLRDAAAAGAIDHLYVLAPDRLAREFVHQAVLVDELQRCGVELHFLNRPLGKTPEDQFLLQMQGVVAEYERAKILERSRRGKLHAARCGAISVLGHAPYGYRYVKKPQAGGEARWEIIEEQAAIVRQLFVWVSCERLSLGAVARRLTEQGLLSPRGRPYWPVDTVRGILNNRAYTGHAEYGKSQLGPRKPALRPRRGQGPVPRRNYSLKKTAADQRIGIAVPALVDEAMFQEVAAQLAEISAGFAASNRSRKDPERAQLRAAGVTSMSTWTRWLAKDVPL